MIRSARMCCCTTQHVQPAQGETHARAPHACAIIAASPAAGPAAAAAAPPAHAHAQSCQRISNCSPDAAVVGCTCCCSTASGCDACCCDACNPSPNCSTCCCSASCCTSPAPADSSPSSAATAAARCRPNLSGWQAGTPHTAHTALGHAATPRALVVAGVPVMMLDV